MKLVPDSTTITSTPIPSPADALAQQTEGVLAELLVMRAGLFTVAELLWLHSLATKLRWGTSVEQEQRLLNQVTGFRDEVNSRVAEEPTP